MFMEHKSFAIVLQFTATTTTKKKLFKKGFSAFKKAESDNIL